MKALMATLLFVIYLPPAVSSTTIASFNIRHLGYDRPTDFNQLAHIIQEFDIVAIQELMAENAIEVLTQRLNTESQGNWVYLVSHAIGRGSYKEHYAFLWNTEEVEYLDGAVVFLDHRDVFAREPLSARFRSLSTEQDFALANIHVLYGDSVSDREPEIEALADYWQWLSETYEDTPLLLMGDFNYEPHYPAWERLKRKGAIPAITQGATTLSPHDGRFASLYDNIWFNPKHVGIAETGVFNFPSALGISHEQARSTVSDHAPVYVRLASAGEDTLAQHDTASPILNGSSCININASNLEQLERLPHIGSSRAQMIIENRPWQSVQHLQQISGIGSQRLLDIIDSNLLCE